MLVYLNGKYISSQKACVSIHDHGFLYGDGVYETIRVENGRSLLLAQHLRRLTQSARGLRLKIPLSKKNIARAIQRLMKINHQANAAVRITLTRGPGPYGFDPRPCRNPTLSITATPFQGYPSRLYARGMRAAIVSVRRNSPASLPPSIKSTNCLNGILAKMESIRAGAQEGILLTQQGFVAEGTVSNVFIVKRGVLITPALEGSFLPGVTREDVLRRAGSLGIKTREIRLKPQDLLAADEVFLTNALMNIMPVTRLRWEEKRRQKRFPIGRVTKNLISARET